MVKGISEFGTCHQMSRIFSSDQLEVCEEVGRGGFGVVYRGVVKGTGQEVAIKQIDLEHESADFLDVNREIQILSECQSPQITQYLGCFVKGHKLWVIMEFVDGGSLHELLMPGAITDEQTISTIAGEVLLALEYLHGSGKIHRDLKSHNILLNKNGEVKLTDFGVSTQLYSNFSRRNTTVGTPYWMAPEVIMNNTGGHSFKADIWSLGCCVFELRNAKPPLQDNFSPMQALRKISSCRTDVDFFNIIELLQKSEWSDSLKDFIASCFSISPRKRPSASKLLQHDFIKKHQAHRSDGTVRLKKVITRKQIWDQDNHVVKSGRVYAPTEIVQNQNKWRSAGSPAEDSKSIRFDFSTIKKLPELQKDPAQVVHSDPSPHRKNQSLSCMQDESTSFQKPELSKSSQGMKTDFRNALNRASAKLEQRSLLSTEDQECIVNINEKLLDLFTPLQSSDPTGSQTKILVCQYFKYMLKEISRQAPQNKAPLQKAIIPSQFLQQPTSLPDTSRKQTVHTTMDEIEHSLLGSWLDKLGK